MSAEALGHELLLEVKEESLDELLYSLRGLTAPPNRYHLGVAALDQLLDIFSPSPRAHRQQTQYSDRQSTAAESNRQATSHEPKPPVVELTGASPSSGRTQLLHHIIALTIIPKIHRDIPFGGKESAVALFDLSSSYPIRRLGSILEGQIKRNVLTPDSPPGFHESFIHESLQHLHVFRPQNHQSLLATIENLPAYFLSDTTSHYSANRPLGALVINNLSSFFWQDRQDAEEQKDAALEDLTAPVPDNDDNVFLKRYRSLITSLRQVQQLFDCPIIATNWALAAPVHSRDGSSLRPHLPGVWNRFRTVNVILQRNSVTKFGPGMSVEEALAERAQRQEAVERSNFCGWVDWWDSARWKEEVKVAARAWGRGGGLKFDIAEEGVIFDGR